MNLSSKTAYRNEHKKIMMYLLDNSESIADSFYDAIVSEKIKLNVQKLNKEQYSRLQFIFCKKVMRDLTAKFSESFRYDEDENEHKVEFRNDVYHSAILHTLTFHGQIKYIPID